MSTLDQALSTFELQGTEAQQGIIRDTLARTDFPWLKLKPGLKASVGRDRIPVEWADLSRYAQSARAGDAHEHSDEDHEHDEPHGGEISHFHVEEDGDVGHGIAFRSRVLGLAWYSGKVTMEQTLQNTPELAGEVFLSEGAHMVDFFYMTDPMRVAVWNSIHPDEQHLPAELNMEDGVDLGHGHGWFDVATYREWVGEEFMGLFVRAFSDYPVNIHFSHVWDNDAAEQVRAALLGVVPPEEPELPEVPVPPTEPPGGDDSGSGLPPFFGVARSNVFHDTHGAIEGVRFYDTYDEAINAGRRPCLVCKPQPVGAEAREAEFSGEPEDADHLHAGARATGDEEHEDFQEHLELAASGLYDEWPEEPLRAVEETRPPRGAVKLITRAQWGARAPRRVSNNIQPRGVANHWEGPKLGYPFGHDRCYHIVRSIQKFHMDTRGWNDIAYNALPCPHGYVFEGRGRGARSAANGTNDSNYRYYAQCYIGGQDDEFTDAAKHAFVEGHQWLGGGERKKHNDFKSTACPGPDIGPWTDSGMPLPAPKDEPQPQPQPEPKPEPKPQPTPTSWTEELMKNLPLVSRTNNQGSRSNPSSWARRVQGLLVANGYAPRNTIRSDGSLDGIFGRGTEDAVKRFQRAKRLGVDGIVGKNTWTKLLGR